MTPVICNGVAASVSGGNFSCNISLNVGVNLDVVRVTDLADGSPFDEPSGVAYPFGVGFERVGRSSRCSTLFALLDVECSGQRLRP